jgi:hypothetical protein
MYCIQRLSSACLPPTLAATSMTVGHPMPVVAGRTVLYFDAICRLKKKRRLWKMKT